MPSSKRWQPPHFRRGCWVESYTRSNGSVVKRHWRNGHHVSGHFSLAATVNGNVMRTPTKRKSRPVPIAIQPSANNAAVAIALESAGLGRATTRIRKTKPGPEARLQAVSWTRGGETQRIDGLTAGTGMANLPQEVDSITLEILLTKPDAECETVSLPAPCFANADGSLSLVGGACFNPELLNRALSLMDAAGDVKQRNVVRQRLGNFNPEQVMQDALADTFQDLPLPQLPIKHRVSVALPGVGYTVTVEPYPAEA